MQFKLIRVITLAVIMSGVIFCIYIILPTFGDRSQLRPQSDEQIIIDQWYLPLYPMVIGETKVMASIASTTDSRIKGLSGTPYLPAEIVKLFVFEKSDNWGFWMQDMQYGLDIIWVSAEAEIVHLEKSVSPITYPKIFTPDFPALYVLETRAGFVEINNIKVGAKVILPAILNN